MGRYDLGTPGFDWAAYWARERGRRLLAGTLSEISLSELYFGRCQDDQCEQERAHNLALLHYRAAELYSALSLRGWDGVK